MRHMMHGILYQKAAISNTPSTYKTTFSQPDISTLLWHYALSTNNNNDVTHFNLSVTSYNRPPKRSFPSVGGEQLYPSWKSWYDNSIIETDTTPLHQPINIPEANDDFPAVYTQCNFTTCCSPSKAYSAAYSAA